LRAKEIRQTLIIINPISVSSEKPVIILPTDLCVIEYEEDEETGPRGIGFLLSTDTLGNYYYRFNNGNWEFASASNKNNWIKVDTSSCNNLGDVNEVYPKLCKGLIGKTNFKDGVTVLVLNSNQEDTNQEDDNLIVHSKTNVRTEISHGDATYEYIEDLCEDRTQLTRAINVFLNSPLEGSTSNFQRYIWDGEKWSGGFGSGIIENSINPTSYNDGLSYIESLVLREQGKNNFESLKLYCYGRDLVITTSSELSATSDLTKLNIKGELDSNIKNNCAATLEEGEEILNIRLVFGEGFLEWLSRDYRYSWNGKTWTTDTRKFYQVIGPYSGYQTINYQNGLNKIITDAESNKNSLEFIRLTCPTKPNPSEFSYTSANFIEVLVKNIKDHCGYTGPAVPIESKTITQTQIDRLNSYNTFIDNAIAVANSKESVTVPKNLIKAMILQESNGIVDALGYCAEVGLMQLTPGTAIDLGANVPTYSTSLEQNCKDANGNPRIMSICRKGQPIQNCKPNEDQRFDAEKNILFGTLYIAKQLKAFGNDESLALYAYNAGPGNPLKYCKLGSDYSYSACTFVPDSTKNTYIPSILGYKSTLDKSQ